MTLFVADISSYQEGLTIPELQQAGFAAVIVKCSQGSGYINPLFAGWIAEAKALGFPCASYHYLEPGGWDGQAAEILRADPDPTIPIWLDAEAGAGLADAVQVADRLRAHGQHLAGFYGPRPPDGYGGWWRAHYLSDPSGTVVDVYGRQGGDGASEWGYGEDLWQFCQHGRIPGFGGEVDFSAFRGTTSDLLSHGWFWTPTPHTQTVPEAGMIIVPTDNKRSYLLWGNGNKLGYRWLPDALAQSLLAAGFPSTKTVAASDFTALTGSVTAAPTPATTVDVAALAADLATHLPPALDPGAVAAKLAPLLHTGATIGDIKALLATLKVTAG